MCLIFHARTTPIVYMFPCSTGSRECPPFSTIVLLMKNLEFQCVPEAKRRGRVLCEASRRRRSTVRISRQCIPRGGTTHSTTILPGPTRNTRGTFNPNLLTNIYASCTLETMPIGPSSHATNNISVVPRILVVEFTKLFFVTDKIYNPGSFVRRNIR